MTDKQKRNYAAVHQVEELPHIRTGDHAVAPEGYAVGIWGSIDPLWIFFRDLEPAMAFGRAARMSGYDIRGFGVHKAIRVVENDPKTLRDKPPVLYVTGPPLQIELRQDEPAILQRWLDGTSPESSHFSPQPSR